LYVASAPVDLKLARARSRSLASQLPQVHAESRRLIPNNLLFDGSYITVADSPARFDEASVVRLIIKGLTDGADTFAQRVVIDVFSIPETIQEFRATYESITMLDQIR